jgi:uncharacterized glyoxalase superfamily metalloenzyme YdcJ
MYRDEVPQYRRLLALVKQLNDSALKSPNSPTHYDIDNLELEHHGAIRVGTAQELSTLRRLFNVMGMFPVDYYDLGVAGIPVHSTAFRAINPDELLSSPFRIFTSLLRLDLIDDEQLLQRAQAILSKRNIFSTQLLDLISAAETAGGLSTDQAEQFVKEALEVFRWHKRANVDQQTYNELSTSHRLIADVVSFKGPHINHLTPKVLDIDAIQSQFAEQGFRAKALVEGPPKRTCPILLRQTSFIALEEEVIFSDGTQGSHTARFGEVEQRGVALTPKGRHLYDQSLNSARINKTDGNDYSIILEDAFASFPDSHEELHRQGLAYYTYLLVDNQVPLNNYNLSDTESLVKSGNLLLKPIIYEDFLPVSAAGIFTSNLASDNSKETSATVDHSPNQESFEEALGTTVLASFKLYDKIQKDSLESAIKQLRAQQG